VGRSLNERPLETPQVVIAKQPHWFNSKRKA